MAVKDKGNGAKHRGRLGKDGPIRALGQSAAVAGTSGVLLLALKAAVLVSPTVLPHAAGAGLNALGIPNALSAIGDTSGALAGNEPLVFQAASNQLPVGDTQPTVTRHGTSRGGTSGGIIGGIIGGGGGIIGGVTDPGSGNGGGSDPPVTPPLDPPNLPPNNPPAGGGGGGGVPNPSPPAKGLVGGVVDTVEKTLPAVKTVTTPLKGVVDTVDGATTVLKPVTDAAKPVTDIVKAVPVVGDVVKAVDPAPSGGAAAPNVLGPVTGTVTNLTGGLTGGLLGH
jgi:hypothetical protein